VAPESSLPTSAQAVRLIVVRAWREESGAFVARVTVVPDLSEPEERAEIVGSPEAAVELVRTWLSELGA